MSGCTVVSGGLRADLMWRAAGRSELAYSARHTARLVLMFTVSIFLLCLDTEC